MGAQRKSKTGTEKPSGISLAATRLVSSLTLALDHLEVVETVLTEARIIALSKGGGPGLSAALVGHAKKRNYEMAFYMFYTHLNAYFRALLHEMARKRPLDIVNKHPGTLKYHEVIKLGSYEAVCREMVDQVFRRLDDRQIRKLIEKVLEHTGVRPDEGMFNDVIKFIEVRHLMVHNSSIVDAKFARTYGASYKAGGRLQVQLGLARTALTIGQRFCVDVDEKLVSAGFVDPAKETAQ